jgi:hypothetical protein
MLHCNMNVSLSIQLGLDDLIADLDHARKCGELGRLALLAYCDARSWARQAGVLSVAEYSMAMFSEEPHQSREVFLVRVDHLIEELKRVRDSLAVAGDQPGSRKLSPPAYQPAASFSHFAR